MTCHLCENSAIGLCRRCFKFYCRNHGDGFCSACQQMGWSIEQPGSTVSAKAETSTQAACAWNPRSLEELTAPVNFVRLLPIFGTSLVHNVLMLVKGVELYQDAFRFDLAVRFSTSTEHDPLPGHRHMGPAEITLADDVGTAYTLYPRGGGGSTWEWSHHYVVTPVPSPAARQLTITVPRLQLHEYRQLRQGALPPAGTYLAGPWIITCAIPPLED